MRVQLSTNQNRTVQKRFMRRRMKLLEFQRQKQLNQRKSFMRIMTWKNLRGQRDSFSQEKTSLGTGAHQRCRKIWCPRKISQGK
jgi:hypothetical protein